MCRLRIMQTTTRKRFAAITAFFLTLSVFNGNVLLAEEKKQISVDELLKTRAAHLFQIGDYHKAFDEFSKLSKQYPDDVLIYRYVGMTLILLGRLDEAASILESAVKIEPDNASLHYYLARAYHEQGAKEKAEKELNETVRLDKEGVYGQSAQKALAVVRERRLVEKAWDIFGSTGYEYDSNVILAPNDKALRDPGQDTNAGRYYFSAGGTYKVYQAPKNTTKAGYNFYRSFHDDSLNEFNYTYQEFSLGHEHRRDIKNREVKFGIRDSVPLGFLSGNLFVWGNELTSYINSRLSKMTFTEIYHRISFLQYGPDGIAPALTSRDGVYNSVGAHHRYYFSNYSRYVFGGYEIQQAAARGDNFDRFGQVFQTGLHTPLVGKLDFDFIGSFTVNNYYHYSAALVPTEPEARRDNDWSLLFLLTYPLNPHWSVRAFYRYINANNKNDIFQYDRQIGGGELSFRY
jgi:hypothetical protein